MMRKFAVALIATTMLVAPALAADAVKSTPAAPVAATTAAPAVTPNTKTATKTVTKTDKTLKTIKVSHRHPVRHMTIANNGKHWSHVKTAKISKPSKTVTATPAAWPTWSPWTETKTDKHLKTFKVAHHHAHHMVVAKSGKHVNHVKTAKVGKPVNAVTAAPAVSTPAPVASTASKPVVKTIEAGKDVKKIKVSHRHSGHHMAIAKNGKPAGHAKTVNVSKPIKHGQVAHEVKSNPVAN
jgi:hypothetical protein